MRALVEMIARALVDRPEAVAVRETREDGETVIELRVAPEDVGKVIGRQGRTARALRTIVAASGPGRGRGAVLEILE